MKRTLLFVLALIASGPVDGVAQDVNAASRELTNRLYEGRTCRRGTAVLDTADLSVFDNAPDDIRADLESRRNWLNCRYVLDPHLDFFIENVGPNATLSILKVSPLIPYDINIDVWSSRCLTITRLRSLILVFISMVTGEIYPHDGDDFDGGVCRG